ncbi:MAG: TetR/AcrR family transcriptional regulator [Magnetococcales bacterium]|nr:TetR/AcrR family transcriptional regulator [Magnetococcales bacterium]MBF0419409.1 TetR/AcrR family transcriptional regulator [Magnetococcales bacterium]
MTRNPDKTRERLLLAAFAEMHHHGFQAASLSRILARAEMTKGAMYHYFKSKHELGYAVVDEILPLRLEEVFFRHMGEQDSFLDGLLRALNNAISERSDTLIMLGCPLNNLAQEMSPVDEEFRVRVDKIFAWWRGRLMEGIRQAQAQGQVRHDIDPEEVALFLLAALEGCIGMAKNAQSIETFAKCVHALAGYVETLRA